MQGRIEDGVDDTASYVCFIFSLIAWELIVIVLF